MVIALKALTMLFSAPKSKKNRPLRFCFVLWADTC